VTFTPPVPEHVRNLPPYIPGRSSPSVARDYGLPEDTIVKLASNENPLGMSPLAREAMVKFAGDISRYPDSDGHDLKATLAEAFGVEPNWLTLGNGSSEILELVSRAFLGPGRGAVISQYCFAVYRTAIRVVGGRIVTVPAVDYGHDLDAMAAAVTEDVDLVIIGNPNNPTGTFFSQARFEEFLDKIGDRAVVLLDEAYGQYLAPEDSFDSIGLVKRHPNLVVAHTFSKIYGLAGLRVGYSVAHPLLTDTLNRVRPTFNVSVLAQIAARASFGDTDFLEKSRRLNQEGLMALEAACRERGLEFVPSKGNFLLIRFPHATEMNTQLLKRGVVVRPVGNYGLENWLRVTIGLPAEMQRFIEVMDEVSAEIAADKSPDD